MAEARAGYCCGLRQGLISIAGDTTDSIHANCARKMALQASILLNCPALQSRLVATPGRSNSTMRLPDRGLICALWQPSAVAQQAGTVAATGHMQKQAASSLNRLRMRPGKGWRQPHRGLTRCFFSSRVSWRRNQMCFTLDPSSSTSRQMPASTNGHATKQPGFA